MVCMPMKEETARDESIAEGEQATKSASLELVTTAGVEQDRGATHLSATSVILGLAMDDDRTGMRDAEAEGGFSEDAAATEERRWRGADGGETASEAAGRRPVSPASFLRSSMILRCSSLSSMLRWSEAASTGVVGDGKPMMGESWNEAGEDPAVDPACCCEGGWP